MLVTTSQCCHILPVFARAAFEKSIVCPTPGTQLGEPRWIARHRQSLILSPRLKIICRSISRGPDVSTAEYETGIAPYLSRGRRSHVLATANIGVYLIHRTLMKAASTIFPAAQRWL
jgi:hypothetical protein